MPYIFNLMHMPRFISFYLLLLFAVSIFAQEREGDIRLRGMRGKEILDIPFELQDKTIKHLKDYQGKWVLVEIGGTWCMPSEDLITTFSSMKEQLGDSFEYIHLYDNHTWSSIILNSHVILKGVGGRLLEKLPDEYRYGFIPVCFLVNPKGMIEWTEAVNSEEELRREIGSILKSHLKIPENFYHVSEYRKLQEIGRGYAMQSGFKETIQIFHKLIEMNPDDPWNYRWCSWGYLWEGEHADGVRLLDNRIAELEKNGKPIADSFLMNRHELAFEGALLHGLKPRVELLAKKYPTDPEINAMEVCLRSLKEPVSTQEHKWLNYKRIDLLYAIARGNALWVEGKLKEAEAALKQIPDRDTAGMAVIALTLETAPDAAKQQANQVFASISATTQNHDDAFMAMRIAALTEFWKEAELYARRAIELKNQGILVPAIEYLSSHINGNKEKAAATRKVFLSRPQEEQATEHVKKIMNDQESFTTEVFSSLPKDPRFFSALLMLAVDYEVKGKIEDAQKVYQLMIDSCVLSHSAWFEYKPLFASFKKRHNLK
jgi:tetratricopeptide (TPR) repeat protein